MLERRVAGVAGGVDAGTLLLLNRFFSFCFILRTLDFWVIYFDAVVLHIRLLVVAAEFEALLDYRRIWPESLLNS